MNRMLFLRDIEADVLIRCRACGHEGLLPHAEAEHRFGPSYPVLSIAPHFRCSKCNSRDCESQAAPLEDQQTPLAAAVAPLSTAEDDEQLRRLNATIAALQGLSDAAHDFAPHRDAHQDADRDPGRDPGRDAGDDMASDAGFGLDDMAPFDEPTPSFLHGMLPADSGWGDDDDTPETGGPEEDALEEDALEEDAGSDAHSGTLMYPFAEPDVPTVDSAPRHVPGLPERPFFAARERHRRGRAEDAGPPPKAIMPIQVRDDDDGEDAQRPLAPPAEEDGGLPPELRALLFGGDVTEPSPEEPLPEEPDQHDRDWGDGEDLAGEEGEPVIDPRPPVDWFSRGGDDADEEAADADDMAADEFDGGGFEVGDGDTVGGDDAAVDDDGEEGEPLIPAAFRDDYADAAARYPGHDDFTETEPAADDGGDDDDDPLLNETLRRLLHKPPTQDLPEEDGPLPDDAAAEGDETAPVAETDTDAAVDAADPVPPEAEPFGAEPFDVEHSGEEALGEEPFADELPSPMAPPGEPAEDEPAGDEPAGDEPVADEAADGDIDALLAELAADAAAAGDHGADEGDALARLRRLLREGVDPLDAETSELVEDTADAATPTFTDNGAFAADDEEDEVYVYQPGEIEEEGEPVIPQLDGVPGPGFGGATPLWEEPGEDGPGEENGRAEDGSGEEPPAEDGPSDAVAAPAAAEEDLFDLDKPFDLSSILGDLDLINDDDGAADQPRAPDAAPEADDVDGQVDDELEDLPDLPAWKTQRPAPIPGEDDPEMEDALAALRALVEEAAADPAEEGEAVIPSAARPGETRPRGSFADLLAAEMSLDEPSPSPESAPAPIPGPALAPEPVPAPPAGSEEGPKKKKSLDDTLSRLRGLLDLPGDGKGEGGKGDTPPSGRGRQRRR